MNRITGKRCLVAILTTLTLSSYVRADDRSKDNPPAKQKRETPDQATLDQWVKQLDHAQLTRREEARGLLLNAGKEAIPVLAKAALADKKELIETSISIMSTLAQSEDKATREAARSTLQMLGESNQPSTAERAKRAMQAKDDDGIKPFEGWDNPNNPLAMNAGAGRNQSVSISNINGKRTMIVKDGDVETKLQDLDRGKISVKVTGEKKNVNLTVKNLEELKQKAPDAHALYIKYGGNTAAAGPMALNGNLNDLQRMTSDMMVKQLLQLKDQFQGNPAMQQLIDEQIQFHKKRK